MQERKHGQTMGGMKEKRLEKPEKIQAFEKKVCELKLGVSAGMSWRKQIGGVEISLSHWNLKTMTSVFVDIQNAPNQHLSSTPFNINGLFLTGILLFSFIS